MGGYGGVGDEDEARPGGVDPGQGVFDAEGFVDDGAGEELREKGFVEEAGGEGKSAEGDKKDVCHAWAHECSPACDRRISCSLGFAGVSCRIYISDYKIGLDLYN